MTSVTLHGPSYSSYTRIARMALVEKGVDYELTEVDYVFAKAHQGPEHRARHPFGKLPVLDHDGFQVYEATAITRYIDDAFEGPRLQPEDARSRARMNQIIGIVDSYVTPLWMHSIFMPRVVAPMLGEDCDEDRIRDALPQAKTAARVLDSFLSDLTFCAGPVVSLADFFLYPQYVYAARTDEITSILQNTPHLTQWAQRMAERPSTVATEYPAPEN